MDVIELWWLSLAIAAVVVAVVAVLLGLIIRTAQQIDKHASQIWTVGKQIAGNTVAIWMLQQTNQALSEITETTRSLVDTATAIDDRLRALSGDLASGGGKR
jgi:uncharacterized protein YoxC